MARMWFLTVFSLITSAAAISRLECPRLIDVMTSRSRSVSESGPESRAGWAPPSLPRATRSNITGATEGETMRLPSARSRTARVSSSGSKRPCTR